MSRGDIIVNHGTNKVIIMFLELKFFQIRVPNRNTDIYADTKHQYENTHTMRERDRDIQSEIHFHIDIHNASTYILYRHTHKCQHSHMKTMIHPVRRMYPNRHTKTES